MNKDLIASIIVAAGCFLFFYLAVPQYDSILSIRAVLKESQQLLTERKSLKANMEKLAQDYQSRKADIDKLAILLPAGNQLDQIIDGIQVTAMQNGMAIQSINAGSGSANPDSAYDNVFVDINMVGGYQSLPTFLKELEKSLRLYDVSEISVSKNTTSGGQSAGNFSINLKFNAYKAK